MTVGAKRARQDGLGCAFIGGAGFFQLSLAWIASLAAGWFLLGLNGIASLLILFVVTWGLKAWFHRKLGGVTGDVIGCVSELNEIVSLLVLLALFGHGVQLFQELP
jgi:adenosylcobinamide-GDP ribazoletransferase